jgi:hypothetical protein
VAPGFTIDNLQMRQPITIAILRADDSLIA